MVRKVWWTRPSSEALRLGQGQGDFPTLQCLLAPQPTTHSSGSAQGRSCWSGALGFDLGYATLDMGR